MKRNSRLESRAALSGCSVDCEQWTDSLLIESKTEEKTEPTGWREIPLTCPSMWLEHTVTVDLSHDGKLLVLPQPRLRAPHRAHCCPHTGDQIDASLWLLTATVLQSLFLATAPKASQSCPTAIGTILVQYCGFVKPIFKTSWTEP